MGSLDVDDNSLPPFASSSPTPSLLTLSRDSTCEEDLFSASLGFETAELRPDPAPPWPPAARKGGCAFPSWAQGRWEEATVSGGVMTRRDTEGLLGGDGGLSLSVVESRCIRQSDRHGDFRFLVYSRSHW